MRISFYRFVSFFHLLIFWLISFFCNGFYFFINKLGMGKSQFIQYIAFLVLLVVVREAFWNISEDWQKIKEKSSENSIFYFDAII